MQLFPGHLHYHKCMVQHENLSFGTLRLCTWLFGFDRKCQFWGKNELRVAPKVLLTFANMAHKCRSIVWQYGLWSFQAGSTKLERFFPKNH